MVARGGHRLLMFNKAAWWFKELNALHASTSNTASESSAENAVTHGMDSSLGASYLASRELNGACCLLYIKTKDGENCFRDNLSGSFTDADRADSMILIQGNQSTSQEG